MQRPLFPLVSAVFLCTFAFTTIPARAQIGHLPALGAPVPPSLLNGAKHEKQCRTDEHHYDPCTEIDIGRIRYTVAWDTSTKDVTYLYTDDHGIVTDTGLAVGNSIRIVGDSGKTDPTVPYLKWVIDPKWKGAATKSGDKSVWYAALHNDGYDRKYDDIVGFVQSRYIEVKK
jgi:hypothetical protein